MRILFLLAFLATRFIVIAQDNDAISWWNPALNEQDVIEGKGWPKQTSEDYNRLPDYAKGKVPNDVWGNSTHSAGMMIRFRSNASEIRVRYQVSDRNNYGMEHMPATGKSGVDLYAINSDGDELWCKALRAFRDTITYSYVDLNPNDHHHKYGREYRLYLPLYNHVQWLEIGVNDSTYFDPLPVRKERPIVVYGTSIAHGACASRPGMAWTTILSRNLDRPLINLGFSGSGRLEEPVVALIAELDPKIFIIDCLPNLPVNAWERNNITNGDQVKERILRSVKQLRSVHPETPILLSEHAGYTEEYVSDIRRSHFSIVNEIQKEAFYQLKKDGYQDLYYLSKEEIGLTKDDMVDGTHPTDLGMYHYAIAYEKKLREILKEPKGDKTTTTPCRQAREPYNYDWEGRHNEILELNKSNPPKSVIFANSIVHFWGGEPNAKTARETDTWNDILTPAGVRNLAYGWDRIENVLWRAYHGELEGYEAEHVAIMIGTNNLHLNTDEEIIEGLDMLINIIKDRQPKASITIAGILPRRKYESRVEEFNFAISRLAARHSIKYMDIGAPLLNEEGIINEELFSDGLHPNKTGYQSISEGMIELCTK